jgi:hypothetical protein
MSTSEKLISLIREGYIEDFKTLSATIKCKNDATDRRGYNILHQMVSIGDSAINYYLLLTNQIDPDLLKALLSSKTQTDLKITPLQMSIIDLKPVYFM